MKIHPVETELFLADGRTDRRDEADSRFFEILRKRLRSGLFTCYPSSLRDTLWGLGWRSG